MILVLNILIVFALGYWGYHYAKLSDLKSFYWSGLILKLCAGISLGLIYTYYYAYGDTWAMFQEALKMQSIAFSSLDNFIDVYFKNDFTAITDFSYSIQPRAAFMSKIIAPIAYVSGGNYWLVSCYLSLFSFAGFWMLANTTYRIFKHKLLVVIPTLFFPSIVFWSSGVIKESIAIGALALLFSILTNFYLQKRFRWTDLIIVLVSLFLLMYLKYYYAAVLIVTYLTLLLSYFVIPKKSSWYIELASVFGVFILILSIASLTHPNFWPSRFLAVIVDNYYQYADISVEDNMVLFDNLSPTIFSLAIHSPKALFAGLFFPLWTSTLDFLKLFSVIENWVILIAFIYSMSNFSLPKDRDIRLLFFAMTGFIVIMSIFITFSSPNIGTLVRYRIGYLIIFLIIIGGGISSRIKST